MNSPSRGTTNSCPVRPGKYARAHISRVRCRVGDAAISTDTARRPEDAQPLSTNARAIATGPRQLGNCKERTGVLCELTATRASRSCPPRCGGPSNVRRSPANRRYDTVVEREPGSPVCQVQRLVRPCLRTTKARLPQPSSSSRQRRNGQFSFGGGAKFWCKNEFPVGLVTTLNPKFVA